MYCYSPLISSPSIPTTKRTSAKFNLYPLRHPSPPFTFHHHHHHHKRRCRIRPTNFTLIKVNSTHKPILSTPNLPTEKPNENPLLSIIAKPIAYAVFLVALGLCPFRPFQPPAIAISFPFRRKKESKTKQDYTQVLLKAASDLNKTVQKVKAGKGNLKEVRLAHNKVKNIKRVLVEEILRRQGSNVGVLKSLSEKLSERAKLIEKSVREAAVIFDEVADEGKDIDTVTKLQGYIEQVTAKNVNKFDQVLQNIHLIEGRLAGKDMALAIAIGKLNLIEMQCDSLVDNLTHLKMEKRIPSASRRSLTKLSSRQIQENLQSAQRRFWEQKFLSNAVVKKEDTNNVVDNKKKEFSPRLKQALEEAQKDVEDSIRKKFKKFGNEKSVLVNNSIDEILNGLPEIELKWMFGDREIVVPNAFKSYLFHGWRMWREEMKDELKRNLLENVEVGKKYVAEKQERILLERDRLMSRTWFNQEKNRWEIDPLAIPYAVSRKLVQRARIRWDRGVMHVFLKGNEKEHFVDLKEFDFLFADFGGFDGLFLQMVAAGTPMAIQFIKVPRLLTQRDLFIGLKSLAIFCFNGIRNSETLLFMRDWLIQMMRNTANDMVFVTIVPALDFINSNLENTPGGMTVLKYADQNYNWTYAFSKWQYDMEEQFESRNYLDFTWSFRFTFRVIVSLMILSLPYAVPIGVVRFLAGVTGGDQIKEEMKRVKYYFRYRKMRLKRRKKGRKDPITSAFDRMKRVRNPPIRLKDFANVDSMREEVNEVVAFLQNPNAFKEMGARAPRGVLIVGESGSGKTSLALAIAAEANVPVVRVQAERLEAGSWVGQGASNIRELFQTARDLAPVIIFVEDFDIFAGIRGKFIDTKKQDHEAFINQLLVELDGFEKQEGVVLMATTESVNKIDKALTRPGRMDRIFHLQRPTQAEREKILRSAARDNMDKELVNFVDWEKVAEKTALMRPVELRSVPMALEGSAFNGKYLDTDELMTYCGWLVALRNIVPPWVWETTHAKRINTMLVNHLGLRLTKEDIESVVDLMEPYGIISSGIELVNPPIRWTKETKFPHAVWAAGRGLVAALLPNFDVVHNLWLERSSSEGVACTKITKEEHGGSRDGIVESRSYLEKRLVFFFSSYVASQLLLPFEEESVVSSSELKQAQELATRMVIQYGWGPSDSPTIYYHNSESTLSMGDNHFYEMASNVEKLYYSAYNKAKAILQNNRSVLEKMVEELVEFEVLQKKDIERIISENGGTRETEPFFLSKSHDEQQPHPLFRSLLENGSVSGTMLIS